VVEKYTLKPLSETFEIDCHSPHHAVNILEEKTGIKIDGTTNAMDWIFVETLT